MLREILGKDASKTVKICKNISKKGLNPESDDSEEIVNLDQVTLDYT